jgi:hypothetical protein
MDVRLASVPAERRAADVLTSWAPATGFGFRLAGVARGLLDQPGQPTTVVPRTSAVNRAATPGVRAVRVER